MKDIITFNGKPFSDFGVYFDGSKSFDTPEKDVSFYSVVGKNGDLSISNDRFKNVEITFRCFIRDGFKGGYPALMNYLASQEGYGRLETSTEPEVYRMCQLVRSVRPTTGAYNKFGSFDLVFNCKPQKFYKSGEKAIELEANSTINNPSFMPSLPIFEVQGTGTITVGDSVLALSQNTGTTLIDCEIQDAYEGTLNRNGDLTVTNGFPTLKAGTTEVQVSGFTSAYMIPRWWRI